MDRILKIKREKQISSLHAHRYIYVWGPTGVGKTYTIKKLFPDFVEIDPNILKTKQGTIDFLERVVNSTSHVIIDDYESLEDLIGLREIEGPVSNGTLIIIGQSSTNIPAGKPFVYQFPIQSPADIMRLAEGPMVADMAVQCKGDLRKFFGSLTFKTDERDVFMSARQVIHSLIHIDGVKRPCELIGEYLDEHGNMMGLIQENYVHVDGVDMVAVTECLSVADIIDSELYDGHWDNMCYFYNQAIITPAFHIGHSLEDIKTASMWTKHLNMLMRDKKIRSMNNRICHVKVDHDSLGLVAKYANNDVEHAKRLLVEYNLESADLDVINHLHKIKTKSLNILKKECRERTIPKK